MKDIKEAKYFKSIDNDINTVIVTYKSSKSMTFVPMDEGNSDYAEILKQVKEGTLTIKDADE
tara:strand:- start:27 stop:212 length:186 start_codon:yes stop_codon:yes gene_type:complete